MLKDITHVQALPDHQLRLRFEDGIEGLTEFRCIALVRPCTT